MSDGISPKRDAGSRGFLDVLRHPVAAFTAPFRTGAPAPAADRVAASSAEGLAVSCFIRGAFDPLPRAWKQGHLILNRDGARWSPGRSVGSEGTPLVPPLRVRGVREVEGAEKARLKRRFFQVVEVTTALGEVALAVPRGSVALVTEHLGAG